MKRGIIAFLFVLLSSAGILYLLAEMNGGIFIAIIIAIAVETGFIVAEIEKLIGVLERRNRKEANEVKKHKEE